MKSNIFLRFHIAAITFGSLFCASAQTPQPAAQFPLDQLGPLASKQYQGEGLSLAPTAEGARLRCSFQQLEGIVARDGFWLHSTVAQNSDAPIRVLAVEIGRAAPYSVLQDWSTPAAHNVALPATGSIHVTEQTARFARNGLTEEYSVSMDGVRQDFIVEQRPAGEGDLRLELAVTGATAEPLANGAQLSLNISQRKLAYNRLRVVDAREQELTARLEVTDATHLAIIVDDTPATYPVRIDPTFSDADWVSLSGLPGADGTVYAVAYDGSGNLYVGGNFLVVGSVIANHIAKWDGNNWSDLNGGLNGTVNALAMSGNDLYVGGSFTTAEDGNLTNNIIISVNGVAKWNGSEWQALDAGVNGPVLALAVSGSDLYVGGSFGAASTVSATRIAKWDGLSWSALGNGASATVSALAVMGGDLYAGGSFTAFPATRIAKWNGSAWSALSFGIGGGTTPSVNALAVSGTDLYAAGAFTGAGTATVANIAKWNGTTWSAVGTGLSSTANSLAVSGSDVYVGGAFTTAGGNPASRIAKWDGSTWSAVGSGANSTVAALAVSGGNLAAGGSFTSPAIRVSQWDGNAWATLGTGFRSGVGAMAIMNGDLYVGGGFTIAGVPSARNIARWDGDVWTGVGGGLNNAVGAMAVSGSDLYVGGAFINATNTGGVAVTVNRVAKWNGTVWSALDLGINNSVSALAVSGNDLYAGGGFSVAGSVPAFNVAKWNGSAWSPLAGGIGTTVNGAVNALVTMGGNLYAAGDFTTATNAGDVTVSVNRIAKWNGSAWSELGTGVSSEANALATDGTTLYAGGFFSLAGGVAVGRIAQWDGNAWSALGFATNNIFVYSLATWGSDLYVGGNFTSVAGVAANNIAKWDGTNWTALGQGVNTTAIAAVNALAAGPGVLYVGGNFNFAGNKASSYVAQANVGIAPGRFADAAYSPGTGFSCTFRGATAGKPYRIQTSPSLASGSWTDFTNFTYTTPLAITVASGSTNRFFRAVTP